MPGAMQQRGRENREAVDRSREAAPEHSGGGGGEGHVVTIHEQGGRFQAQHGDGSTSEHEHLHGAMAEAGSRHMGGMHHMTHHDGMGGGFTTHHAAHGESAEGPNEHPDTESVKSEMDSMMGGGGEEHEDGEKAEEDGDY